MTAATTCPLCESDGGVLVARSARWRIVRAGEPGFPAFYRLVWHTHAPEFSDLPPAERAECMEVVAAMEQLIRRHLRPAKVNLASLGNQVPHLHWHVIARFAWDSHFPAAVWAAPLRPIDTRCVADIEALRPALESALGKLASPA